MINLDLFKQVVLELPDGVVISDANKPDLPIVFVNPAFENMTGYSAAEVMHRNCRFLQLPDTHAAEKALLHEAIANGKTCTVILRNLRKDGSLFWNELNILPIHDEAGNVVYFVGLLKDISSHIELEQQLQIEKQSLQEVNRKLEVLVIHDELTGIYNRMFFDSQFDLQWKMAARNKESIALLFIDIEHFSKINTQYGHESGNRILKKVAEALSKAFSRSSDFIVRYGGDEFIVLAAALKAAQTNDYVRELKEKIRNLDIPPLYTEYGYAMINLRAGVAVHSPQPDEDSDILLKKALNALNTDWN